MDRAGDSPDDSGSRLPRKGKPPAGRGAVAQIEIDQSLIGNTCFLSQTFEIIDRAFVQADGHLTLQARRVGIAAALRKNHIPSSSVPPLFVDVLFSSRCLTRGDDSHDVATFPVTADDDQCPQFDAHAQKEEAILSAGVIWIIDQDGELVGEVAPARIMRRSRRLW